MWSGNKILNSCYNELCQKLVEEIKELNDKHVELDL